MTRLIFVAGAGCALAAPSLAEPIEYTLSGRGTGFFAADPFADAAFSFTLRADTDDIMSTDSGFPRMLIDDATVTLDGFDEGPSQGFDVIPQLSLVVNPGSPGGIAGLVLGNPVANFALVIIDAGGLPQYDLVSDFGPVTDFSPFDTELFTVATSGGLLTITTPFEVTFEARVIPAPASGLVLGGLAFAGRRRR